MKRLYRAAVRGIGRGLPLLLVLGLLASCAREALDPAVLAKVGSVEIGADEFQRELETRRKANRLPTSKEALLGEMIHQKALLARAKAAGLENDPELRRAFNNLLVNKLKERELTSRVESASVSEQEVRNHYEENLARYTHPAKARLALLFLKGEATISAARQAEVRARMEEARQRALQLAPGTAGFGSLAAEYSEDQVSRYKGGDVGWVDEGQAAYRWPIEVVSAGFALRQKGEVSEVIASGNGFYLVTLMDLRPSVVTPLEKAGETIRRRLLTEKREQIERVFAEETRRSVQVITNQQSFAAVEPFAPAVAKRGEAEPPSLP